MSVPDWAPGTDGETVLWQGQPRKRVVHVGVATGAIAALVVLAGSYAGMASGAFGLGLAAGIGVTVAPLSFFLLAGRAWLWRWSNRYVLTDVALYHRTGVLSLTVTELRLGKIQNTSYSQGILGSIFDYGNVTVDTAGGEGAELTLAQLDDPGEVHQRIREQAGEAGSNGASEIPGSLQAWQDVRAEVQRFRAAIVDR